MRILRDNTIALAIALAFASCRPPAAKLEEAYLEKNGAAAATVDHSLLDKVLKSHVEYGIVDYTGLHANRTDLDAYLALLKTVDFEALGRDEKLALLINAYNAFTLALIVNHWPVKSIKFIPESDRWKAKRWQIGKLTLSLDEIEHSYLRPKFKEPRIHFAVNCASIGCPPLRSEVYRAKDIDTQLDAAARFMHNDPRWLELGKGGDTIKLTKLYDWFGGDFEQVAGTTLKFAARFHKGLAESLAAGKTPSIQYLDYDWNLNGK